MSYLMSETEDRPTGRVRGRCGNCEVSWSVPIEKEGACQRAERLGDAHVANSEERYRQTCGHDDLEYEEVGVEGGDDA